MTRLSLLRLIALLGTAVVLLGCSPARKESNDSAHRANFAAPTGTWPGLSPSTPREKPARKREPRRFGRRAIALTDLPSPQKP